MILPIGTRIQIIDNSNLRLELGERGTLQFRHQSGGMFVLMDGDHMNCMVSPNEVEIIIDGKGVALGKRHFISKKGK